MTQLCNLKGWPPAWLRCAAFAMFAVWMTALPAYAQFGARDRILEPVDASRWSVTRGNLRPGARPEFDQGELNPATRLGRVTMFFNRTPEQEADLQALLAQLQDRGSANYHRWLSPEEFAGRFGVSQSDLDKVVAWLQAQGLTVEQVSRSRTWVAFSGTAQQVEAAFRTDLRRYTARGETHFMMSREPSVPSAFAGIVLGFRGLDDFRLKPRVKRVQRRFTSEISGNHFLAPGDFATIYGLTPLYSVGTDGTAQKIAVAGQAAIDVSDVQTFRSLSGLPTNNPGVIPVLPTPDPNDPDRQGHTDEAYLDLEWAGAVARNATVTYVYSANVLDAFTYIVEQGLWPVLSISYGLCEGGTDGFTQSEANILASIAQQANAKGITIVAPAGDSGAADCDYNAIIAQQGLAVDLPGALPYVTSVGGTRFDEGSGTYWAPATSNPNTALSYIPETSWNDTGEPGVTGLAATGGGSSIYFPKPSWQTGAGVPQDGARDVPDVSFSASGNHDGYLVCSRDVSTDSPSCVVGYRMANGVDLTVFGGTSAGVPVFAGIVALLNQVGSTPAGQGNVNPRLYALAASSPSSFHDITTGDNEVPFQPSTLSDCTPAGTIPLGYSAGTGYDLVTGLGSIDAQSFVTTWTSVAVPAAGPDTTADFQLSLSPSALTVSRGACGTTQLTLTRPNGFAGTPVFTCSPTAPLTAVTCSVSPVASASVLVPRKFLVLPWWPLAALILTAAVSFELARRTRRAIIRTAGLAFACLLVMLTGCSGGGGGSSGAGNPNVIPTSNYDFTVDAPASATTGTGTVTVTAAIGGVTRSVQLSLTVN